MLVKGSEVGEGGAIVVGNSVGAALAVKTMGGSLQDPVMSAINKIIPAFRDVIKIRKFLVHTVPPFRTWHIPIPTLEYNGVQGYSRIGVIKSVVQFFLEL